MIFLFLCFYQLQKSHNTVTLNPFRLSKAVLIEQSVYYMQFGFYIIYLTILGTLRWVVQLLMDSL